MIIPLLPWLYYDCIICVCSIGTTWYLAVSKKMLDLPPMEGNRENEVIAIIVIGKWAQMMYLEPSNLEVPYFLTKTACWRKPQFHQQEWGCHQPKIGWKDISTMMIWAILGTQEVRRWGIIMGSCTYKYESLDTHQRTQCLICIHVQLQTYDFNL